MVKRDPKHESALKAIVKLDAAELRRRIAVGDYKHPDYVTSEVLAAMVRNRFGQEGDVLDAAASTLYARLMKLADRYIQTNPQWEAVALSSSETLQEATSKAWFGLVTDKAPVCFAEVRFLPFVEARVEDYLQGRLAQKNQMAELDSMDITDDNGNVTPYAETLEADQDDGPEAEMIRKQKSTSVNKALMELDPKDRRAVYFRVECEYDWKQTAKLLGCSVPTARKYYNQGMAKLRGAL